MFLVDTRNSGSNFSRREFGRAPPYRKCFCKDITSGIEIPVDRGATGRTGECPEVKGHRLAVEPGLYQSILFCWLIRLSSCTSIRSGVHPINQTKNQTKKCSRGTLPYSRFFGTSAEEVQFQFLQLLERFKYLNLDPPLLHCSFFQKDTLPVLYSFFSLLSSKSIYTKKK